MASNTQAICTSFKAEVLQALHNFGTTVARTATGFDTMKAALFYQNSGLGSGTTSYNIATVEVTGTGYTAGGVSISNATIPQTSGTTAYWTPSSNISWSGLTITSPFDACLLYNAQFATNRAICVLTFPAQTIASGTFTITMPANAATSALIQVN